MKRKKIKRPLSKNNPIEYSSFIINELYFSEIKTEVLYADVTNDLMRGVYEHKRKLVAGYTQKYNAEALV